MRLCTSRMTELTTCSKTLELHPQTGQFIRQLKLNKFTLRRLRAFCNSTRMVWTKLQPTWLHWGTNSTVKLLPLGSEATTRSRFMEDMLSRYQTLKMEARPINMWPLWEWTAILRICQMGWTSTTWTKKTRASWEARSLTTESTLRLNPLTTRRRAPPRLNRGPKALANPNTECLFLKSTLLFLLQRWRLSSRSWPSSRQAWSKTSKMVSFMTRSSKTTMSASNRRSCSRTRSRFSSRNGAQKTQFTPQITATKWPRSTGPKWWTGW